MTRGKVAFAILAGILFWPILQTLWELVRSGRTG